MSDRETILRIVTEAQSRMRTNRVLERLALRLTIWVGVGLVLKLTDLARPFSPGVNRGVWMVWLAGLAGIVIWSLRTDTSQRRAAAEVDRKAQLEDEILSAWWFIHNAKHDTPGVGLHLKRAAEKAQHLDLGHLYPRVMPRLSLAAAGGLILLVVLQFTPLPLSFGLSLSAPRPPLDLTETESLMEEIESLLERAEALAPDGTLGEFQELMTDLRDPDAPFGDLNANLDELQSALDEGNLSTAGILEGLEDMAEELMGASDSREAGEALAQGDLEAAAAEFDQLAEALANSELGAEGLAEALERAAQDARPGLDGLAQSFEDARLSLEAEDDEGAAEALAEAADALRDLSDLVEGQNLRNQASDRIDDLRESLEGSAQGDPGEPGSGESQGQGEQSSAGDQASRPGENPAQSGGEGEGAEGADAGEGAQPGAGDSGAEGQAGAGQQAPGQPGTIESAAGGDSGMMPAGLGFSPEQKTGLATSLEVQLEQQATEAIASREQGLLLPPEEEASRQERSRLDYREVPSELTTAQQELLNQEQIPREYRNLIREYFQAIRPPATQ